MLGVGVALALVALTAFGPGCRTAASGEAARNNTAQAPAPAAAPAPTSAAPTPVAATTGPQALVVLSPADRSPSAVRVEVARTEPERRQGLMFRKSMEQDDGMLFLFDRPQHLTFWMHNTYLRLDMIFIDTSMHVLGVVEDAAPLTDDSREVPGLSQYVLEVNAGYSHRHGIKAGTAVRFEHVLPDQQGH